MTPRGKLRVTLLALMGKRPHVMSRTHHESVWEFEEYVEWLKSTKPLNGTWAAHGGSMPIVRFDGGGSVRFVSSPPHLDGCEPDQALMDEILR